MCFLVGYGVRQANLHDARRHDGQDEVQPYVSEDAPKGGDEKNPQVLDLAGFSGGDDPHTQADDDKHVEGGTSHDGPWAQLTRLELVPAHLPPDMWEAPNSHYQTGLSKHKISFCIFQSQW